MIHPTAIVGAGTELGEGTSVWHHAHIRENTKLGRNCVVGQGAYIDHDVVIGDSVKIQNGVQIYYRAEIADGVFIGPGVILTNDKRPRAITPEGGPKSAGDWDSGLIRLEYGASVGAGAVVLTGVTIGRFAMVGAGALVTKDVAPNELVLGVPAKPAGYVCACGHLLEKQDDGTYRCVGCHEVTQF